MDCRLSKRMKLCDTGLANASKIRLITTRRGSLWWICTIFSICLFMTLPQPQAAASYIAEQGVLDLKSWDADHDGAVRLDGEWALDWQQYTNPALSSGAEVNCESCNTGYVQVPGIWKSGAEAPLGIQDSGYATYRLTIQTAATDGLYGLYLKSVHSAYRLYINGTLVSSVGEAGTSPASTTGHYGRPVVLFHHQGTELELMLQVANYSFPTGELIRAFFLVPRSRSQPCARKAWQEICSCSGPCSRLPSITWCCMSCVGIIGQRCISRYFAS